MFKKKCVEKSLTVSDLDQNHDLIYRVVARNAYMCVRLCVCVCMQVFMCVRVQKYTYPDVHVHAHVHKNAHALARAFAHSQQFSCRTM